MSTDLDQND